MVSWSSYWLSQGARVGWFLGQYVLSNRLARGHSGSGARRRGAAPARNIAAASRSSGPTLADLLADIASLFRRDWRNVRDGLYAAPHMNPGESARLVADAVRYFEDFRAVDARRRRDGFDEVRGLADAGAGPGLDLRTGSVTIAGLGRGYPDYYLRNFHYQSDGYLSRRSARLYDQQVEVLFIGSADAMRRQALVPIAGFVRRRRAAGAIRHLDVGCGTGRFLASVRESFPSLASMGLDLSPHYLAEAAAQPARRSEALAESEAGTALVRGLAEALPVADASVDLVTCIYLLHEVPGEVRERIAAEIARVLRPGGRLVVCDSLQYGDRPAWDGLLRGFPRTFHEPFYADYAACDLAALFGRFGLRTGGRDLAFLSKILVFDKDGAAL